MRPWRRRTTFGPTPSTTSAAAPMRSTAFRLPSAASSKRQDACSVCSPEDKLPAASSPVRLAATGPEWTSPLLADGPVALSAPAASSAPVVTCTASGSHASMLTGRPWSCGEFSSVEVAAIEASTPALENICSSSAPMAPDWTCAGASMSSLSIEGSCGGHIPQSWKSPCRSAVSATGSVGCHADSCVCRGMSAALTASVAGHAMGL
mmetsp:Transcript_31348/g.79869  ORF Transcript_31348/g.79869 Transcript_31348/m.79869 type:complete len:207 (-) Transcript_31348:503-1123(-)